MCKFIVKIFELFCALGEIFKIHTIHDTAVKCHLIPVNILTALKEYENRTLIFFLVFKIFPVSVRYWIHNIFILIKKGVDFYTSLCFRAQNKDVWKKSDKIDLIEFTVEEEFFVILLQKMEEIIKHFSFKSEWGKLLN